jgi:hypothetical protein
MVYFSIGQMSNIKLTVVEKRYLIYRKIKTQACLISSGARKISGGRGG